MSTLLTIITTAITTYAFTLLVPYVKGKWNAFRDAKKREFTNNKPYPLLQLEITQLSKEIEELKEQMDNVAKNSYRRETNRKSNIRRDVREYLKELQNG